MKLGSRHAKLGSRFAKLGAVVRTTVIRGPIRGTARTVVAIKGNKDTI